MTNGPVIPLDFDSALLQIPSFRVVDVDAADLGAALAALPTPSFTCAKLDSAAREGSLRLQGLGFRKVCMQVHLRKPVTPGQDGDPSLPRMDLPDAAFDAHAANFTFDRLSLDPLLPRSGICRFYRQWLVNSLTQGKKRVVAVGDNLCTFHLEHDHLDIDLFSVLDKRQGMGRRLLALLDQTARASGATEIRVTTECENQPAWSLYHKYGFVRQSYSQVFQRILR